MKQIFLILCIMTACLFHPTVNSYSWEHYDSVIAVVNSIPIIESDVDAFLGFQKKYKTISTGQISREKSKIIDKFIEDALIQDAAKEESIVVNDTRVYTELEKIMKNYYMRNAINEGEAGELTSKLIERLEKRMKGKELKEEPKLDKELDKFINNIENSLKMDFSMYFEELRVQIRKNMIMSITLGVSPPSKKEVEEWYKNNAVKIGYEVRIKHILIRPKESSLTAESDVNNKLNEIRQKIADGESFEKMAQKFSQDPATASKGGDLGWVWLAEIAESDIYFAGYVSRIEKVNEISRVFKSNSGYHIVKLTGKRIVPLEKVENRIAFKLHMDRMASQFQKWIEKRRSESIIRIYMKDYSKG